jgi:hypothetical protein
MNVFNSRKMLQNASVFVLSCNSICIIGIVSSFTCILFWRIKIESILGVFLYITIMSSNTTVVDLSQTDSIVASIVQKFMARSSFGKNKYGTDLDRSDLSILDWIQHAQEEHMDAILYLEKLKAEYQKSCSSSSLS